MPSSTAIDGCQQTDWPDNITLMTIRCMRGAAYNLFMVSLSIIIYWCLISNDGTQYTNRSREQYNELVPIVLYHFNNFKIILYLLVTIYRKVSKFNTPHGYGFDTFPQESYYIMMNFIPSSNIRPFNFKSLKCRISKLVKFYIP